MLIAVNAMPTDAVVKVAELDTVDPPYTTITAVCISIPITALLVP